MPRGLLREPERPLTGSAPRLAELARELLLEEASPSRLGRAAEDLHALLAGASGLGEHRDDAVETLTGHGRALSPVDAARCVRDAPRTAAYLRGVAAALRERRRVAPGRPLELLYAGTGPFAPLVLPLLPLLEPGALRVTFLDFHPRSVELLSRLVDAFGLRGSVRALSAADATAFTPETPLDALVVEAMEGALAREPQVAITRRLVPALARGGVLLPERVTIDLAFGRTPGEALSARLSAGAVFALSARTAAEPLDGEGRLPAVVVTLPPGVEERPWPLLVTRIEVHAEHAIPEGASGLTVPRPLTGLPRPRSGERLAFFYGLGREPGLVFERLG